ncbi:MAG TPA: AhpC/TSA family protein [Solirubrobacteraceae bacterium]|nr:AhpC/TSA family protein [Solirubrobacteraceae bacterium]
MSRGIDLRTFVPPRPTAVAEVPRPGQKAPPLDRALGGRPLVVAFLRHVGCPFAEATFSELSQRAAGEDHVHFIAVSHASPAATREWCSAVAGGPGAVELVFDEQRSIYAAWGLGRSSLAHFMGTRSLRAVADLGRKGVRNRHPSGTRWQTAGTFAVDAAGVIRWVHVPEHAGSLPDLDAAALAARAR